LNQVGTPEFDQTSIGPFKEDHHASCAKKDEYLAGRDDNNGGGQGVDLPMIDLCQ
jgi:hypothetical protein